MRISRDHQEQPIENCKHDSKNWIFCKTTWKLICSKCENCPNPSACQHVPFSKLKEELVSKLKKEFSCIEQGYEKMKDKHKANFVKIAEFTNNLVTTVSSSKVDFDKKLKEELESFDVDKDSILSQMQKSNILQRGEPDVKEGINANIKISLQILHNHQKALNELKRMNDTVLELNVVKEFRKVWRSFQGDELALMDQLQQLRYERKLKGSLIDIPARKKERRNIYCVHKAYNEGMKKLKREFEDKLEETTKRLKRVAEELQKVTDIRKRALAVPRGTIQKEICINKPVYIENNAGYCKLHSNSH